MKRLEFLGSSRDDLCALPDKVRHDLGLRRIETEIEEYVAAALDAAGIGEARIFFLAHDLPPIIL